ncbi:MAG: DUF4301 family protein [Bacteroidales bacterium]
MKAGLQFGFTDADKEQMRKHGIRQSSVETQMENFEKGFPYAPVVAPATTHKGIYQLSDERLHTLVERYDNWQGEVEKFVPASGAATRMFKHLYTFLENRKMTPEVEEFLEQMESFAFFPTLAAHYPGPLMEDVKERPERVLEYLLTDKGLNYGWLPKGLIPFHEYDDSQRTPFEEHIVEGVLYAKNGEKVSIHFTISPEHELAFNKLWAKLYRYYEEKYAVRLEYTYSFQHAGTDTIAVTPDNKPFRTESGELLFRPGGHGALLGNLNSRNVDILFIKNIDNVVPDGIKEVTVTYKKALAGLLLEVQEQVFHYQKMLDTEKFEEVEKQTFDFLMEQFPGCLSPDYWKMPMELRQYVLFRTLFRPIRVCGMVKNEGEPGGGPFWVEHPDGSQTLQIVEMAQLNMHDKDTQSSVNRATHFNPVDLVCGVRNYHGDNFDLPLFRDDNTGFIAEKSYNGKKIKAQELPGLWNGAMARWHTLFVEVPIETFNPVKTVNDLLRPMHQVE